MQFVKLLEHCLTMDLPLVKNCFCLISTFWFVFFFSFFSCLFFFSKCFFLLITYRCWCFLIFLSFNYFLFLFLKILFNTQLKYHLISLYLSFKKNLQNNCLKISVTSIITLLKCFPGKKKHTVLACLLNHYSS